MTKENKINEISPESHRGASTPITSSVHDKVGTKTWTKENSSIPSVGAIIEGKVVAKDRSSLFIDLGIQGTGIIYGKEFYEVKEIIKGLNIGDTVLAKVVELENDDGYRELSLRDATKDMSWQKLKEMKEKEETIRVKITGVNKGGLLTDIDGVAAFLPVSQLSSANYPRVIDADKQKILKELQKFIGKTLEVKVLDSLAQENKLILSERAKTEQEAKNILANYKKGDVVEGKITGIANFGVFIRFPLKENTQKNLTTMSAHAGQAGAEIDPPSPEASTVASSFTEASASAKASADKSADKSSFTEVSADKSEGQVAEQRGKNDNGVEGLIHISELDWQLVQNPAEVVKVGEIVKAQIVDIDNNQVFLSLKRLKENPWEEIEKKYNKGDVIKGKVISFSPFGAFVEILPQIRGLCHISEFKSQKEMEESLKSGETYDFTVLLVDSKEHRMSLKLVTSKLP